MFLNVKTVWGNKDFQVFFANFGEVKVYPLNNNVNSQIVLYQYLKYVGVSTSLHMDNSK